MLVIIIAAIVAFILLIPIKAVFKYHNGADFFVEILFIKIRPAKKKKDHEKQVAAPQKKSKSFKVIKKVLTLKDDILEFAQFAAKRCIVIQKLIIKLDFGIGDAAKTGVANGGLNGVIYTAVSLIHHNTLLKEWKIDINPDFQTEKFDAEFLCIARTRLLHIICMAIKGYKLYNKFRKV